MLQRLKDLALRAQKERKMTVIALAICGAILFMVFYPSAQPRMRPKSSLTQRNDTTAMAQREAYDDIMLRFKADLDESKSQMASAKQETQEIKKSMQDYEERTAEIFKKILERMAENQGPGTQNASVPAPIDVTGHNPDSGALSGLDDSLSSVELESFGDKQPEVAPPAPPGPQKVAFVGAGDSVRIKLLAGVNAPTDGTPYPVVFKLVSDVYGPDGSVLPLGEARLIAAAQGSLTDSRALFRLTSMNIRLPNGQRKVLKVDGWVVGEDGIRGMPGVLIDPIGKAIGGAGFAAGLGGIGEGIAQANSTTYRDSRSNYSGNNSGDVTATTVTGDIGQYAAGKGLSASSKEWASIIKDRLSDLVPAVQVLSGREGTAVFAKSLTISGLYEALDEDFNGIPSVD